MKEVCPDAIYVTYRDSLHMFVYDEAERTAWDIVEWMNDIPKDSSIDGEGSRILDSMA
jgi:hypothetical protein